MFRIDLLADGLTDGEVATLYDMRRYGVQSLPRRPRAPGAWRLAWIPEGVLRQRDLRQRDQSAAAALRAAQQAEEAATAAAALASLQARLAEATAAVTRTQRVRLGPYSSEAAVRAANAARHAVLRELTRSTRHAPAALPGVAYPRLRRVT